MSDLTLYEIFENLIGAPPDGYEIYLYLFVCVFAVLFYYVILLLLRKVFHID